MKAGWTLALLAGLVGCLWKDNPDWIGNADLRPAQPDLMPCPTWATFGGGGQDRPQVLVPGGMATIEGVAFSVPSFELDVYLVTVAGYRDCVTATACTAPATTANCNWTSVVGNKESQPVNCVTWAQANAFCQWAERRLPTEEEWQVAAGANIYAWGNDSPIADGTTGAQLCWNTGNSGTCQIGSYPALLLGARDCGGAEDLAGNVWEWTSSEYHEPYAHPAPTCDANSYSCSIRGGSWDYSNIEFFQASNRGNDGPTNPGNNLGFRCARTP